jgi:HK97 family phage portal protein
MKLFNIFKRKERRSGTANPAQWLIDWVTGGSATSSGANVNENSALKYTPFWAAVRVISGTIAALPFKVYKNVKAGKEKVPSHTVQRLLNVRPNAYIDSITFKEVLQNHVLTYGNGFAEIQRDGAGRPVALWPLLPDRTERKLDDNKIPYFEIRPQVGPVVNLPEYNVLHIKGLGFDGYTGYGVVAYHKEAIGYGVAVKEYGARFFGNEASPGG